MATTISSAPSNELFDTIFGPPGTATPTPVVTTPVTPAPTPEPAATPITQPNQGIRELSAQEVQDIAFATPLADPEKVAAPDSVPDPLKPVEQAPAAAPANEEELTPEDYTKQVFKATAGKLIKSGTWQDVEGFEEMDLDEDSFAELAQAQVEAQIGSAWEAVKSSHEVVAGILSVIEAGGNPDSIIDLFKEQQSVQQIDTTTPEGKLEMIGKFYTDIVGMNPTQVKAKLRKLDTESEADLQVEFELAEGKYTEHFQKEQTRLKDEETRRVQTEEAARTSRIQKTAEHLKANGGTPAASRKLVEDMYQPRWKLPTGEQISELDKQILDIKNDPIASVELAKFILDRENYKKSLTQTAVNQTVDSTFGKLKFAPKKTGSTTTPSTPKTTGPTLKDQWNTTLR